MEQRSKNGHRQRMRNTYLVGGADAMDDCKLLELYLSLVIPRKDVRELSYALYNKFGSLNGVFSASVQQLMTVDGVGENTAVLISLTKDIHNRIGKNGNTKNPDLSSAKSAIDYFEQRLSNLASEKLLVVALDNKSRVIGERLFVSAGVNFMDANPKAITEFLLFSNATGVIVGHNHPNGYGEPSAKDINFTISFRDMMKNLKITLLDHIIVGSDSSLSMRSDKKYCDYFNKNGFADKY